MGDPNVKYPRLTDPPGPEKCTPKSRVYREDEIPLGSVVSPLNDLTISETVVGDYVLEKSPQTRQVPLGSRVQTLPTVKGILLVVTYSRKGRYVYPVPRVL